MITKLKVFNFKSIREETELDLGPLTIFAGPNNSGKSALIQSLLLVAQTLTDNDGSQSIVLNGSLASLGQFDDLKSNGGADQISIKFTCRPLSDQLDAELSALSQFIPLDANYDGSLFNQPQEISCEISFDADASSSQPDLFQIQPRLIATQLSCVFKDERDVAQKAAISIHHSTKAISEIIDVDSDSEIDDDLRDCLAYAIEMDDGAMAEVEDEFHSGQPIGCELRHFLPETIVYAIDTIEEDANAITKVLQGDSHYVMGFSLNMDSDILVSEEILSVLREVLEGAIDFNKTFKDKKLTESLFGSEASSLPFESWYDRLCVLPRDKFLTVQRVLREREDLFDLVHGAMKSRTTERPNPDEFAYATPPSLITEATQYLDNFFASSLKYLGPLRDAPKPLHPLSPEADPHDVGLRGEHASSILELHKNKEIHYIPSANFKDPVIDHKTVTRTLEEAVIDWLQYLGVASSLKSQDQGKSRRERKKRLSNSDSAPDLTRLDAGVNQVLPILVMGLLADPDSTLVFEHPERALHPNVQILLGDFFLSMALSNKQCVVETHSEYLIDRLRFRIAASTPEEELNTLTKVYFVENPSRGSTFREVVINEY
jgi:predicted ATPase